MDWRNGSGPRNTIQDLNRILLETGKFSDVLFLVGSKKTEIKAHKFILMTRSSVFEVMFGETWNTTGATKVEIPDAEPEVFNSFLKFLYYNDSDDFVYPMEVLYLAHKYSVAELVKVSVNMLRMRMDLENVLPIYHASKVFELANLRDSAMAFMLKNASGLVKHQEFFNLDEETLLELAGSNELCIKEIDLFLAIQKWSVFECERQQLAPVAENFRTVLGNLIRLIRFPLMTPQDFSTEVASSDILNKRQIISIFMHLTVTSEEKRKDLSPIPYNSVQRAPCDANANMHQVGRAYNASSRYTVGVYLCNEVCARDSLSYRIGPNGLLHDEDLNFSANRDIQLIGVGLYGPGWRFNDPRNTILKSYEVDMNLYTLSPYEGQRNILAEVRRCISTREDFEVHFMHPVLIRKDRVYHIRLGFRGEETKHGISRLSHVATNAGPETILFTFHGPFGIGSYGQPDGRIRSIVFNYP